MVKKGDRIRLISMSSDPDPIPAGSEGTVTHYNDLGALERGMYQIGVKWDSGRTLSLVEEDDWQIIP